MYVLVTGYPTVVQTNILIRSMGPVSELDMASTSFTNAESVLENP